MADAVIATWVLTRHIQSEPGGFPAQLCGTPDTSSGMQPFISSLEAAPVGTACNLLTDDQLPDVQGLLAQEPAPAGIAKLRAWGRTLAGQRTGLRRGGGGRGAVLLRVGEGAEPGEEGERQAILKRPPTSLEMSQA